MSWFWRLLILLGLAALGAWGWHALASDPGQVIVTLRGYSIETTVAVALFALLLAYVLLRLCIALVRFPLRYWSYRKRFAARARLASGLVALHEGRWLRAEKLLARAASESQHRLPALLNAARAAQARGDETQAARLLGKATECGDPVTVALLAARQHQRRGDYAAITQLFDPQPVAALPPRALDLYVGALVETGRAQEAALLLPTLRASKIVDAAGFAEREDAVLAATLEQAPDGEQLDARWNGLTKPQRLASRIAGAFAARAVALGREEQAVEAVEKSLKKGWSSELAAYYAHLPHGERKSPLKVAERWLADHPDDPELLITLGHLCRREQFWGKAEEYLNRALANGGGAKAWEELAHACAAQNDNAHAQQAYANALAALRGEDPDPLPGRSLRQLFQAQAEQERTVVETRSSMGVPLLPEAK